MASLPELAPELAPSDVASGLEPSDVSESASGLGFSLRAASVAGDELRPTMYPIEKNTPSKITTIRNTLINWRFPSTNSNSPSSFFGKMI